MSKQTKIRPCFCHQARLFVLWDILMDADGALPLETCSTVVDRAQELVGPLLTFAIPRAGVCHEQLSFESFIMSQGLQASTVRGGKFSIY